MTEDFKDVSGLLEEDRSKIDDKVTIGDKIDIVKPIIPIKPIRAPKFAAMRSMAEYPIPTPVTRKEMFLNVIAGGISELPTPKTREELYLAKICGMDVEIPIPLSRYEMYLYALSGGEWEVPEPKTRLEIFLYHNLGFEVETPEPVTREEIYWNGGQAQPTTIEGVPPLTFTAKRTGNLEDYTIYGNTVQNGTPTPDSPIEPEFVGDRTENLLEIVPEMYDPDNWELSPLVTNKHFYMYYKLPDSVSTEWIKCGNIAGKVFLKGTYSSGSVLAITSEVKGQSVAWNEKLLQNNGSESNYTHDISEYTSVYLGIGNVNGIAESAKQTMIDAIFNNYDINIVSGTTAPSSYVPYGYKIPISSGGVTKNIYLGQVPTTRKIKKLVLTGEESLSQSYNRYRYYYTRHDNPVSVSNAAISNILLEGSGLAISNTFNITNEGILEFGVVNTFSSLELFQSYLATQYAAGTPVVVWYVLATPEVGIFNEPLCKIGDYADSVDFSQAGVEIPVIAGENTLSVGTEVQPSNMSITYK